MRFLLSRLPLLVLAVAAVDGLLVRVRLPWREHGVGLLLQAFLLWAAFALVAIVPALVTLRVFRPRVESRSDRPGELRRGARAATHVLAWMLLPVLAHAALDRHVGLEGRAAALKSARAWVEVAGVLALALALLFGLRRALERVSLARLAVAVVLVVSVAGLFPRRPTPNPPTASAGADAPNILLLVWDTCRSDRLMPYGYDRETSPHLARFAEDSIVFENSVSASIFTFSSHLTMLTGAYPSTHGGRLLTMRYDPRRAPAVAETLRLAGYRTGAFVGTDVLAGRTGIRHGFERYDDQVDPAVCDTSAWQLVHDLQAAAARILPALRNDGNPHWIQDFQRPAADALESAAEWIAADDPRPWFCFVNLYDVHWPYVPRSDANALIREYGGDVDGYLFRSDAWKPGYRMTEADKQYVRDLYEAEIVELDRVVDGFLGALDLDAGGTAVVMTSDHGEAFGEHEIWKHEDIYEPQVRVPLIVRPAVTAERAEGRRVAAPVSGVDVGPTILGLAGLEVDATLPGLDVLSELPAERPVFVEDRDHLDPLDVRVALYRGPWKLVRWGLGDDVRFELYDLRTDSMGIVDVSAEHPDVLAELTAVFLEHRAAADASDAEVERTLGGAADGLEALGYTGN